MIRQTRTSRSRGFTLVELSLAILMVALLAMAILTISLQIMKIYSKGVTLKSMNQVSRDVGEQLTRDMRATPISGIDISQIANGRLCLGSISYLWNTMDTLNGTGSVTKIQNASASPSVPVYLARVVDQSRVFCRTPLTSTVTAANQPVEFLGSTVNKVAVYKMTVTQLLPTLSLYQVDFTLGTNDKTIVTADQSQCKPPTDAQQNFDFCTVSEFHLLIKASDAGGN